MKGVKLEDKFRFILIKEKEKKGGQSESQTDGVHLYYLKDWFYFWYFWFLTSVEFLLIVGLLLLDFLEGAYLV